MPCPFCAPLRASRGVVAAAVAVVLAVTSPVTAQHIGDILVESSGGVSSAGRLTTGAISEDGSGNPVVNHEVRAFAATFGLFPSYTDSPGFDSHGGGGLHKRGAVGRPSQVDAELAAAEPRVVENNTRSARLFAVDENRFANLLASMDDSEDFADLERRTFRALTAAGDNKAWQAQVKAFSKKLLKKFPPPSDTTRG